jgi:hypothetical protein
LNTVPRFYAQSRATCATLPEPRHLGMGQHHADLQTFDGQQASRAPREQRAATLIGCRPRAARLCVVDLSIFGLWGGREGGARGTRKCGRSYCASWGSAMGQAKYLLREPGVAVSKGVPRAAAAPLLFFGSCGAGLFCVGIYIYDLSAIATSGPGPGLLRACVARAG